MPLQADSGQFALNTVTGNQTVSGITDKDGVAFTPKAVLLFLTAQTAFGAFSVHMLLGMGFATATTERFAACGQSQDASSPNTRRRYDDTKCLILLSNTGTVLFAADFVSFASGAFTINITTAPAGAYQVHYAVLGGTNLENAKVMRFQSATAVGDQTLTGGPGSFTPNAGFFISAPASNAPPATVDNNSIMFGFNGLETSGGGKVVSIIDQKDTTNAGRQLRDSGAIAFTSIKNDAPAEVGTASVKTWATDTVLTWGTAPEAANYFGVLFLRITSGYAKTGQSTVPTAVGVQTGPSLGFEPTLWLSVNHAGDFQPVGVGPIDDASFSIGMMASATKRGALWGGSNDGDAQCDMITKDDKAIILATHNATPAPAMAGEANARAFTEDTWEVDWTQVPSTSPEFEWIALGQAAVARRRRMLIGLGR